MSIPILTHALATLLALPLHSGRFPLEPAAAAPATALAAAPTLAPATARQLAQPNPVPALEPSLAPAQPLASGLVSAPQPADAGIFSAAGQPTQALAFLFEPNQGRAPERFDHLLRLPTGWAALGSASLELWTRQGTAPRDPQAQPAWQKLAIELVGAEAGLAASPEGLLGSWSCYRGKDRQSWTEAATTAERLRYRAVWPGIDVLYHAGQAGLRYDFCVAPGASPATIRLRLRGVESAEIAADGRLLLQTAIGNLEESAPRLFQAGPEGNCAVNGGFVIHSHDGEVLEIGFAVGAYDATQSLLIDPYFSLFALFGGSSFDSADTVVSDNQGAWFVAGTTRSADFPYYEFATGQPVSDDIYLLRYNDAGLVTDSVALISNGLDVPYGLAYRQHRVALVAASPGTDMPIQGQPYQAQNLGGRDAYVAVFTAQDLTLEWSSYLGGNQDDQGFAVSFASDGDVLVAGETTSANFPAIGPIDNGLTGTDAFVARFEPDGSDLVWAGSYGNLAVDSARAVAGAADGSTWLAGEMIIADNPQAFVVRFSEAGAPDAPAYFGGAGEERATDLLLDGAGGYWLLGETDSNDLDLVQALSIGLEGTRDAFLVHRDSNGTIDFSSYLGGSGVENAIALGRGIPAIGGAAVHVLLGTGSSDLPSDNGMSALSKPDPFSALDGYVLGVGPGPDFDPIYASYLPCLDSEVARDLAADNSDRLLVVGNVVSSGGPADLPATQPALPADYTGGSAAFLCWINNQSSAVPGSVRFGAREESVTLGENLRFLAYRIGGSAGAASVPWQLYDPAEKGFVEGYGGILEFAGGQQVAEGFVLVPAGAYPDGKQLFLVLQDPEGPVELDSNHNTKELSVYDPLGGGIKFPPVGDSCTGWCCLVRLVGPDQGQRGLDRLRWVRDQVLSRFESGRQFTLAYYAEGPQFLRWLEQRPLLWSALAALTWALLWMIGYAEWLVLGSALLHQLQVPRRLHSALSAMAAHRALGLPPASGPQEA